LSPYHPPTGFFDDRPDVEIVFHELPDSSTRVEIEHSGWERLGEIGSAWRDANHAGWDGVLPSYAASCNVG